MRGVLISGTDTDVGKTYVTALIARELVSAGVRLGVYKPACSGADVTDGQERWADLETLSQASGIADLDRICPQRFAAPLAPPIAAREAGRSVDWDVVQTGLTRWESDADFVLVEGVGGLLCPLTDSHSMADFAIWTGLPVIIVARLGLGTINHTLLTLEAAERRGLCVEGVILNDVDNQAETPAAVTNVSELRRLSPIPVLGTVSRHGQTLQLRDGIPRGRMAWLREIDDDCV
jgi:dethiobiotin synthetase